MSDGPYPKRYKLSENVHAVVSEYLDHPVRRNAHVKNLFCADGWWRVECWILVNGCPTLFATIIMVRVFDEKWHGKFSKLSDRLCLLYIPVEGYFQRVTVMERENALIIQYSPNEQPVLGYLGLKVPSV